MRGSVRGFAVICLVAWAAGAAPVRAQQVPRGSASPASAPLVAASDSPAQAISQRIAVWRFDALGIEPELVARLEALFRSELDRLAVKPLPSRRELDRKITADLADCTGEDRCLAAIGKRLDVDVVVAGSVGALGDNFVLSIKVVDVASAQQLRRITTDPLRGTPDDLIDSVRVAAYRLLAPDQIHGSIAILSDLIGGDVAIDGKRVGQTPLAAPVGKLALGPHVVRVTAKGFAPFEETVEVRFQKSARVEVRLTEDLSARDLMRPPPPAPNRWYSRTWVVAAIGVGAVVVGAVVGYELGSYDRQCDNCASVRMGAGQ
jgi:PEGA domain